MESFALVATEDTMKTLPESRRFRKTDLKFNVFHGLMRPVGNLRKTPDAH